MVGTIAFKTGSGGKLPPPEKKSTFIFSSKLCKKLIFTPLSGCKTLSSELRKIFTALFDKKNGALQICPPPPIFFCSCQDPYQPKTNDVWIPHVPFVRNRTMKF